MKMHTLIIKQNRFHIKGLIKFKYRVHRSNEKTAKIKKMYFKYIELIKILGQKFQKNLILIIKLIDD